MRKWFKYLKVGLAGAILAGAVVYWMRPVVAEVESTEIAEGIHMKYRASGSLIEVYSNQTWNPYFAKGVNMGATIPGHFPGELAITEDDYTRWFEQIQAMGANVIRVYTILNPEFYEALVKYNAKRQEQPLFFIQGVWSPEEQLIEGQDAFDPEVKQQFEQEIIDAVHAVYGSANLKPGAHSGKASGVYKVNAGPYLMGWIIGTEWDPGMVEATNEKHADVPDYRGAHFASKPGASPFEKWLAEMVDIAAQTEVQHGWQHPIAFTNWVTTDPLEHPGEPLFEEDMVSVNPSNIEVVQWEAGYFASYHVYPYYPDFFSLDKSFQTMTNERGEIDSYTTYLHKLKQVHPKIPVMITEFGVPASQGTAHLGMLGRDQGGHDEQRQGEINADLFRQIHQTGYSGAILFTWQDEWFKKTWNTLRYDNPDRRAYWYNTLTNESFFGVLGMFPGKDDDLFIDGDASDWDKIEEEEKQRLDRQAPGFEEIWASHDEGYLYLMAKLSEPFDPAEQTIYVGTDTLSGGNRHAPQLPGVILDEGLETLIELKDEQVGHIRIASNYDFHARLHEGAGMPPADPLERQDDSGIFKPWKLAVNYKLEYPDSRFDQPFVDVDAGDLLRGNSNPADPDYHSKAMWQTQGQVLEIRIPWMLLGFSDPSSLSVLNYKELDDGKFDVSEVEGIRIVPWIVEQGKVRGWDDGDTDPPSDPYPVSELPIYTWPGWEEVDYVERPKRSYTIMQRTMKEIDRPVITESDR